MEYKSVLTSSNDDEKKICCYLISKCEAEESFKNDVESHEDRSVDGMMKYIYSQAEKIASGNRVLMLDDNTVYNIAFDYWHDETIDVVDSGKNNETVEESENPVSDEINTKEEASSNKQIKKKPIEEPIERISLFDL